MHLSKTTRNKEVYISRNIITAILETQLLFEQKLWAYFFLVIKRHPHSLTKDTVFHRTSVFASASDFTSPSQHCKMNKNRKITAVLSFVLLLLREAAGRNAFWGHNSVGIRLSPRQRSVRLSADSSSSLYPSSTTTSFSRRDQYHASTQDESVDALEGDLLLSTVDFCSVQNVPEPTIQVASSTKQHCSERVTPDTTSPAPRGGAAATTTVIRPLVFWENMVCGAISRSVAQTVMHPANTMKTILQSYRGTDARPTIASLAAPSNFRTLTRGAGANFLLSVPHGAVNFAVLEFVRSKMSQIVESNPTLSKNAEKFGAGLDFLSSAISTICCSVVSTPQMMITDNIMAGNYPNLPAAAKGLAKTQGIAGFYTGWWPGLAGKIPSYVRKVYNNLFHVWYINTRTDVFSHRLNHMQALTWTLFQQLRAAHSRICDRPPTDIENSIMGCIASATTVTIMIPMDTIKTRLVTQTSMAARGADIVPYKGIVDCALRIAREEGINVFYRGLPPRLVSVVPMIGIQFGVYEFMKKVMLNRSSHKVILKGKMKMEPPLEDPYGRKQALEEALMEVAASPEQPFPAPHFRDRYQSLKEIFTPEKKQKKSSAK